MNGRHDQHNMTHDLIHHLASDNLTIYSTYMSTRALISSNTTRHNYHTNIIQQSNHSLHSDQNGLFTYHGSGQGPLAFLKIRCFIKRSFARDIVRLVCARSNAILHPDLSSHLIYPLTAMVVGAPQMISQPVSCFSLFSTGPGELHACPFPDVVIPIQTLMLSSHLFLCLHCLLHAYGVEISAEKTKLMTNNTSGISTDIKVNGQKLKTHV